MIVENVYFSTSCFSSNNVILLGHIASSVYFTLVVDLAINLNSLILSLANVPAHSAGLATRELNLINIFQVARYCSTELKSSLCCRPFSIYFSLVVFCMSTAFFNTFLVLPCVFR